MQCATCFGYMCEYTYYGWTDPLSAWSCPLWLQTVMSIVHGPICGLQGLGPVTLAQMILKVGLMRAECEGCRAEHEHCPLVAEL